MSYYILADGKALTSVQAEGMALLDAKVNLEANKAGTCSFTMMPDHPCYDSMVFRQTIITVYQNGEIIFEGVPVREKINFNNSKTIECEGELSFLNDTIQRQVIYTGKTISELLTAFLTVHNAQADNTKQFTLGTVTVTAPVTLNRYTNYQTTMSAINELLINEYGGYLRVRHSGGVRYLDYLASSPRTSTQVVSIGKNLMDLVQNSNSADICTVLIPLGAKTGESLMDGLDERLTIKSVNNGNDYIIGTAAATLGYIWKTITWDDITTAATLLSEANSYLSEAQWASLCIDAKAVDLGLTDEDVDQFRILDSVRVISAPHGLDMSFLLTKLTIDLNHPGNTRVALGVKKTPDLSRKTVQNSNMIMQQETTLQVEAAGTARVISTDVAADAVSDFSDTLDAEDVFNRLTDNGTVQGIFKDEDTGDLYINGEFIQANTIRAGSIETLDGQDWLDVLNQFFGLGSSDSSFVRLGGWKVWAQEVSGNPSGNYITFAPATIGGIYVTLIPAGRSVTTINQQSATAVAIFSGNSEDWALTKEYGLVGIIV